MNTEFYVVGYSDFNDNFYFVQKVSDKLVTVTTDEKQAVKFDTAELANNCLSVVEDITSNSNYDVYRLTRTLTKVEEQSAEEPANNENSGENTGDGTN